MNSLTAQMISEDLNVSTTFMNILSNHIKQTGVTDIAGLVAGIKVDLSRREEWLEEAITSQEDWSKVPENLKAALLDLLKTGLLHRQVDRSFAAGLKLEKASCKKGCAWCCHYPVSLSEGEGYLLALLVRWGGVPISHERLESQQKLEEFPAWLAAPNKESRCIFLSAKNTCEAYEFRPASCRSYAVQSPAEFCDADKHRGHPVAVLGISEAELWSSTIRSDPGSGYLPHKVKKYLDSLTEEDHKIYEAFMELISEG